MKNKIDIMKNFYKYNRFLPLLLTVCIAYLVVSCSNVKKQGRTITDSTSSAKPNLLIILTDQWQGMELGFLNNSIVKTPTIDSLAKHSLVLNSMISNYPVCSPARVSLMTGKYPFSNHVYGNTNTRFPKNMELSTKAVTWSDILNENGYSLGYIGKWHMEAPHKPWIPTWNNYGKIKWNEWTPPERRHGFDFWYAYNTYDYHLQPMYWNTNAGRWGFHFVNEWSTKHEVDKAIAYLKNKKGKYRQKDNPFALMVSMNPPHSPYKQVPEKYYDLYKDIPIDSFVTDPNIPPAGTKAGDYYRNYIRYYYAAISGADEQIGRLLVTLKRLDLANNTIVLFTSDHGNCLGKHHQLSKDDIYESAMRVPFILNWERHIKPRIDNQALMSYPDIYPTLMDLMGLKDLIPNGVEGKSYAHYILTGNGQYPQEQYFMGKVKFNMAKINRADSAVGFRGIRTKKFKLAYRYGVNGPMKKYLFNLNKDPHEMNNLYGTLPQVTDSLRNILFSWLKKTRDPFIKHRKLMQ